MATADEKTINGVTGIERADAIDERVVVLSADKIPWQRPLRHDQLFLSELTTDHIKGCREVFVWLRGDRTAVSVKTEWMFHVQFFFHRGYLFVGVFPFVLFDKAVDVGNALLVRIFLVVVRSLINCAFEKESSGN